MTGVHVNGSIVHHRGTRAWLRTVLLVAIGALGLASGVAGCVTMSSSTVEQPASSTPGSADVPGGADVPGSDEVPGSNEVRSSDGSGESVDADPNGEADPNVDTQFFIPEAGFGFDLSSGWHEEPPEDLVFAARNPSAPGYFSILLHPEAIATPTPRDGEVHQTKVIDGVEVLEISNAQLDLPPGIVGMEAVIDNDGTWLSVIMSGPEEVVDDWDDFLSSIRFVTPTDN